MAVYVDALRKTTPVFRRWPYTQGAHLLADDLDELHAFAARLGMRRAWFQPGTPRSAPHYDLSPARHAHALDLGAELVDRRRLVEIVKRLRGQSPSG